MNIEATLGLLNFFGSIDYLLVILLRCFGFFMLMPVFAGASIPNQLKIALALFMAYLIFSTGTVTGLEYDPETLSYFYMLIIEFLTGVVLAFAVYLAFTVFYIAGQIMDYQIGFAMVNVMDPFTQAQMPITGNIIYMLMLFMLAFTGGLQDLIYAFVHSFTVIPIGGAFIIGNDAFMRTVVDNIIMYYTLAIRISMPVLGTILIIDVALGLLVKGVQQMNIFVVGMPIKLLIGLIVFFIAVPGYYYVYDLIFIEGLNQLLDYVEVMVT